MDDDSDSDVIGTWKGSDDYSSMELKIVNDSWSFIYEAVSYVGSWTRTVNQLSLKYENGNTFGTATLISNGSLTLIVNSSLSSYFGGNSFTLTKGGSQTVGDASLEIKNESFTEITNVMWQSVSFANNQYENSIKTGTTVTQNVKEGAGYLFFKRKSNPIFARTQELVVVGNKEKKEFTFTDNTVVVEVNNTSNAGTLGALQSTVVFFDDAEGEIQPYYERRSFVGYYIDGKELLSSSNNNVYSPKNGKKSIAVGGTNTALLHLKINLSKKAKLSFWYANKYISSSGATFSINGTVQRTWTTDINWSKIEFDLEPGINDLIWAKKDGYNSSSYSYFYFYLSLDDILIYYTE